MRRKPLYGAALACRIVPLEQSMTVFFPVS